MAEPGAAGSEELVLAFLAEAGDEVVSGEAISDKLGLSRAAVWKHVEALRGQGYRIDAVASRGYRLVAVPDRLRALELRAAPQHPRRRPDPPLPRGARLDQRRGPGLADDGAEHGEVVVAERQTGGRGRRGRSWVSPPGRNVAFSVVLRPEACRRCGPPSSPWWRRWRSATPCATPGSTPASSGPTTCWWAGGRSPASSPSSPPRPTGSTGWWSGWGSTSTPGAEDFPPELRGEATSRPPGARASRRRGPSSWPPA